MTTGSMTIHREDGMNRLILASLMFAVFTVSVGYSVVLPLLPKFIAALLGSHGTASLVSRHTGFLTGIYSLALFVFAPAWGRFSDKFGRRGVLLTGLFGFSVTLLASSLVSSLVHLYAGRFLNGIFASAVAPVAGAAIRENAPEEGRGRALALLGMAGIAGFLTGPALGAIAGGIPSEWLALGDSAGPVGASLVTTAGLAVLAGTGIVFALPRSQRNDGLVRSANILNGSGAAVGPALHVLTFIVSFCVGVFEVGLALRGAQGLGLTVSQIALMFTACSMIMFAVQAIVFSPFSDPVHTRWLIAPAFLILAAGLLLVNWAPDYRLTLATIGSVSASAGVLSPVLTYWISAKAGDAQGWELGKQTAAASLGVTVGSAIGGLLFNVPGLPGASFMLASGLALVGVLLSRRLPQVLSQATHDAAARVQ